MPKFLKGTIILTVITLISGLALGAVYGITKDPIAAAALAKKQAAYKEVFAEADSFEDNSELIADATKAVEKEGIEKTTIDEIVAAYSGNDLLGYIVTVTNGSGYGGDIQFTVGINTEAKITGISFLSIAESPGLGMTAKDDETWAPQYYDKDVDEFSVIKGETSSDNEISAISGATITSKAVTAGVNASLFCYREFLEGGNK